MTATRGIPVPPRDSSTYISIYRCRRYITSAGRLAPETRDRSATDGAGKLGSDKHRGAIYPELPEENRREAVTRTGRRKPLRYQEAGLLIEADMQGVRARGPLRERSGRELGWYHGVRRPESGTAFLFGVMER